MTNTPAYTNEYGLVDITPRTNTILKHLLKYNAPQWVVHEWSPSNPSHMTVPLNDLDVVPDSDRMIVAELSIDDSVLTDAGFVRDDYGHYQDLLFASWRRDDLNIIATPCSEFFFAEVAIAHAAKIVAGGETFDMNTRAGRVAFHADIRGSVLMRFKQLEG
jgi:hypothetical protein